MRYPESNRRDSDEGDEPQIPPRTPAVASNPYQGSHTTFQSTDYTSLAPTSVQAGANGVQPKSTLGSLFRGRNSNASYIPFLKSGRTQMFSTNTTNLHAAELNGITSGNNRQKVEVLNLDDLGISVPKTKSPKQKSPGFDKKEASGKNSIIIGLVAVVVLGLLGAVVALSATRPAEAAAGIDNVNCNTPDFDDDSLRQIIADNFDAAVVNGVATFNMSLPCLPADAFALLSPAQADVLLSTNIVIFERNGMSKVSELAFTTDAVVKIKFLKIVNNGLTFLPDGLLQPLDLIETVDFGSNAFSKIENEVFRNAPFTLKTIFLSDNSGLVEIPSAFSGAGPFDSISITNSVSLRSFRSGLFEDFQVTQLILTNSLITTIFDLSTFVDLAGVNTNVTTVTGF